MLLNKIEDPRDNLEKAKLGELVRFANANGLRHVTYDMPAILIRQELRSRNLTNIQIPRRPLGAQNQGPAMAPSPPPAPSNVVEVNAAADLARQYAQQQAQPTPPPLPKVTPRPEPKFKRLVPRPRQEINILRDECKRLGIKMDRRDRLPDLKAKIEAHGKNAS